MYIFSIALIPTPVNKLIKKDCVDLNPFTRKHPLVGHKFIKSVYLMNTFDFAIFFLIHCNTLDYKEFTK